MKKLNHRDDIGKGLKGKTVVVTGASSGVGRAIAREFAREGTKLVLAARRKEALDEVVAECRQLGAEGISIQTDVTDAVAMRRLADSAKKFGGRIDVWVNNAGVLAAGEFSETPVEVHDQVIRINLMGYLHGAHAAMHYFKQQGYGILINNISVGGWFPVPYGVGYSASKFGLRGLSEALRGELHKWPDINVCDVFPAFLDTPGIQHAGNYTGRILKPAPPVSDPQRVARRVVSLAKYPKNAATVGSIATFLRLAHFFVPGLSRIITATVIEAYLKNAAPTPSTNGNLFEPVNYGTSIHGGWSLPPGPRKKAITTAFLLGGIAAGLLLLKQRTKVNR